MTPPVAVETEWLDIFPQFAGTRRFTVDEYHRLRDANILGPSDRVEMLDGYVIYKADYVKLPTDGAFSEWRLLRRWTVSEYRRMIALGIIGRDEKLELLDGYLVLKMPQSTPHRASVVRLTSRLAKRLPSGWMLMTQVPVTAGFMNPEPDGAILRGADSDYDARDPDVADLSIVIEVADSSLEMDRTGKGRLYARAGVPVYWIINVDDRQIEVYSDPDPSANPPVYQAHTDFKPGDSVPIVLDGALTGTIPVSELIA